MAVHSSAMHQSNGDRAVSFESPPHPAGDSFYPGENTDYTADFRDSIEDEVEVMRLPGETTISGANINYTLHVPRDSNEITDEAVTVIAHGFGGIQKAYYELADSLAAHGKPTATIHPPRSMGIVGDLNPANYRHPIELNSKAIWAVMRDLVRQEGVEVFDILGHSLGGRSGTDAVNNHPDYVRNLTLYGSVGVTKHKLPEMLVSLAHVAVNEMPAAADRLAHVHGRRQIAIDFARYVLRNPARTVAEGIAAGTSDICDDILEAGAAGIRTSKVYFPADGFFHPERVLKHADGLFHMLHLYEDVQANHVVLQTNPAGTALAHLAITEELGKQRADLKVVA